MYNATIEPKSIHLAQAEHTSEIGSLHMLDEITEWITSKFVIFSDYKNSSAFFRFSLFATLLFFP